MSEVQKSQEAASAAFSASNSLKEQSEIKFNHTGNERNFKFNGQVSTKLVSLKNHLADLPPDSEAFSILDETIEILQERNRKIRIADSSEAGWLTVKHYKSNPVSLSENDDMKIRAAERQAFRDQARQRKKRNVEGFAFRNRQAQPLISFPLTQQQQQQQFISVFPYKYMVLPTKVLERKKKRKKNYIINHITRECLKSIHKYSRQFNGSQRSWQFSQPSASSSTNQHFSSTNREFTRGPCRYCGSSGHWWKECPVRLARFHIDCSSSQLPASYTGTVNRP